MFNRLFGLYSSFRSSTKTPLEDYTTECLVGVVNSNEQIKKDFVKFLGLPENDTYSIEPQKFYSLEDKSLGCIIDIVVKGRRNLCFIENKVESKENFEQLKNYAKILSNELEERKNLSTYLIYCTKYYDPKDSNDFKPHNFIYKRWYDIFNEILIHHKKQPLVKYFSHFLKKQNMAQELTLSTNAFQVMEQFPSTFSILLDYLNKARPSFEKLLSDTILNKNKQLSSSYLQIDSNSLHPRYVYNIKDIVNPKEQSDFNYGFYFGEPRAYVGLYISDKNKFYNKLVEKKEDIEKKYNLEVLTNINGGIVIKNEKNLSKYLNNNKIEKELLLWFNESFEKFHIFFCNSEYIKWNESRIKTQKVNL